MPLNRVLGRTRLGAVSSAFMLAIVVLTIGSGPRARGQDRGFGLYSRYAQVPKARPPMSQGTAVPAQVGVDESDELPP